MTFDPDGMSAAPPPPTLAGQMVITIAAIQVGTTETGQRAIMIQPQGTAFSIILPLDEDAAKTIGAALLAKHVVMPSNGPMI
jgi:hypothetical protein